MSLTLALNTALSGLNVNQRALSVLSQNIANANNPEYSRKIITQQSVYLEGNGAGVQISDIGRKVDEYLQKAVINQGSDYGRTQALADYTDRLQVLLGKPGSSNSIYSNVTSYFNALQQLSQTPENASLRVSAVSTGQSVAREMSTLAKGIYDMQYAIDQEILQSVSAINTDLKGIYSLNASIASDKLLGRSTSELEDSRDTLLKDLSGYIDIQTYKQNTGVLNVFAAGGFSLVDDSMYALGYNGVNSADSFASGTSTGAISIYRLDSDGHRVGAATTLVSGGVGAEVESQLSGGKLKGLLDLRDLQLPDVLAKLDMLAGTLRDEVNALHNSGIAFPGASSYTGTREMSSEDYNQWSGQVRIAVLDQNGKPVPSNYDDESSGMRPLLIDLEALDTGNTAGFPSVQGIIDEINRYYGMPQNKVELGNVNDIRLVLNNETLPGATPQLDFDFQLDNISGEDADFYVTDIQVLDDTGADITDVTRDVPSVALASTGTYTTVAGSNTVTIATTTAHGFAVGDRVFLTPPASDVDGIEAAQLGGFFTISNVTASGFDITAPSGATAGGAYDRSDVEVRPVYYTAETGTNARSKGEGTIVANIAGHTTSDFYTVKANVSVVDADGNISTSLITYRIDNLASNVKNYRYPARSATGAGQVLIPNTIAPAMTAKLVDANGNELPVVNNQYTTAQTGFLKLTAGNSNYFIAIDSLDSAEGGRPNASPAVEGTGRGFAHYFELNNFFTENRSDAPADDVAGSARSMGVASAISRNVNLVSLGSLVQSTAPVDPDLPPLYTYERHFGDNNIITQLAGLSTAIVSFAAAGDLGSSQQTLASYAGQMLSTVSTKASTNKSDMNNSKLLLDGFNERSDSLRGVNLDEELANTIIYQNAYSASARIITVANQFFETLMDAMR